MLRPEEFPAEHDEPPDDLRDDFGPDYWRVEPIYRVPTGRGDRPEDEWHFNPRRAVRSCDLELVHMWFTCGGREGLKVFPQAGGYLDQSSLMMDAFTLIAMAVGTYPPPGAKD